MVLLAYMLAAFAGSYVIAAFGPDGIWWVCAKLVAIVAMTGVLASEWTRWARPRVRRG